MGAEQALRMDRGSTREDGIRSLEDVAPGEAGVVYHILFELVRARCHELGIRPGVRLSCVGKTPDEIRLGLPEGREVDLERHYAHFVQMVGATDGPARGRSSAGHAGDPDRPRLGVA